MKTTNSVPDSFFPQPRNSPASDSWRYQIIHAQLTGWELLVLSDQELADRLQSGDPRVLNAVRCWVHDQLVAMRSQMLQALYVLMPEMKLTGGDLEGMVEDGERDGVRKRVKLHSEPAVQTVLDSGLTFLPSHQDLYIRTAENDLGNYESNLLTGSFDDGDQDEGLDHVEIDDDDDDAANNRKEDDSDDPFAAFSHCYHNNNNNDVKEMEEAGLLEDLVAVQDVKTLAMSSQLPLTQLPTTNSLKLTQSSSQQKDCSSLVETKWLEDALDASIHNQTMDQDEVVQRWLESELTVNVSQAPLGDPNPPEKESTVPVNKENKNHVGFLEEMLAETPVMAHQRSTVLSEWNPHTDGMLLADGTIDPLLSDLSSAFNGTFPAQTDPLPYRHHVGSPDLKVLTASGRNPQTHASFMPSNTTTTMNGLDTLERALQLQNFMTDPSLTLQDDDRSCTPLSFTCDSVTDMGDLVQMGFPDVQPGFPGEMWCTQDENQPSSYMNLASSQPNVVAGGKPAHGRMRADSGVSTASSSFSLNTVTGNPSKQRPVPREAKPWTSEEDALLLLKLREFGAQYRVLASHFPGRSVSSCKHRVLYLKSQVSGLTEDTQRQHDVKTVDQSGNAGPNSGLDQVESERQPSICLSKNRWIASVRIAGGNGRKTRKSFSVLRYGNDGALRMAIEAYREMTAMKERGEFV